MNRIMLLRAGLCLVLLCLTSEIRAQFAPERRAVRQGNRAYEEGDWVQSEQRYRTSFEKADTYEAWFNLGDALYRQGRLQEAAEIFGRLGADVQADSVRRAQDFYNQGNALFGQKQYEQAAEAYRQSLRLNPDDREAKFNLAYALEKLRRQQEQQNPQDQNQNQNQDRQDRNRQNPQDQDRQDRNDPQSGEGEQNRDERDSPPQEGENPGDPQRNDDSNPGDDPRQGDRPQGEDSRRGEGGRATPSGMSREEADRMLDAVQQQENNTRDKVNEQRVVGVARSGKNW